MKLVKKILRLLPIIYMLFVFISIIFSYNQQMEYQNFQYFLDNLDLTTGTWDGLLEFNYFNLVPSDFFAWFSSNVSDNYLFQMSLSVLFYELYLSLAFIMFDFINMVFGWANKLIDRGANSVE